METQDQQEKKVLDYIREKDRYLDDIAKKFDFSVGYAGGLVHNLIKCHKVDILNMNEENDDPIYTVKLLPGEIREKKHRYKCFLCGKEVGTFEHATYGRYCVCHLCVAETMRKVCEDEPN